MDSSVRVLYVDDDQEFADLTRTVLERKTEMTVMTATGAEDGLDRLTDDVDCIVSDYDMPGTDGLAFLRAVRNRRQRVPFILFTGKGSEEIASDAISAGVTDYIQKEGGTDQYVVLANRIRKAVSKYRAEKRLQRSENRYRTLIEQAPIPIVIYDTDGVVRYANDTAAEFFAADSTDQLVGTHATAFAHPDVRDEVEERLAQLVESNGPAPATEQKTLDFDGNVKFSIVKSTPITFDGDPAIQTVAYDITERKRREQERRWYEGIVEMSQDTAAVYDADGRFKVVNERLAGLYDSTPAELRGERSKLVEKLRERHEGDPFAELVEGERDQFRTELELNYVSDGRVTDVRLARLTDEGEFTGIAAVGRDVSDRLAREQELERQNERLDEFASVVSHDLRSPLHVAEGNLELAREECESDHLDDAVAALDRSQALIDDLLTLAREGESVSDQDAVDLASAVEDCWQTVATVDASLTVVHDTTIRADELRLQQLLENLVRNAVEHGGEDVTVTVGTLEDASGFFVADDGPGIPEDDREQVFESGYSNATKGTGFGLSIVEEIASAHGWSVDVTDSEDGGARFEIAGVDVVDG